MPYRLANEHLTKKYASELTELDDYALLMPDKFTLQYEGLTAIDLVHYLIWLGNNAEEVSAKDLAILALAYVSTGMMPGEVVDDLGLPKPSEWD